MTKILQITDGTTTIDLLDETVSGIKLLDWAPLFAQWKGGGVFQSSPISDGRRLRYRVYDTVPETMPISVVGATQDAVISNLQALIDLLEDAVSYWLDDWNSTPVYLVARADNETNTRYAIIHKYEFGSLPYPYAGAFVAGGVGDAENYASAFSDITMVLERGHWLANIPGSDEATQTDTEQAFTLSLDWEIVQATGGVESTLDAANGYLFAGRNGDIYRSVDGGDNWASNTVLPAGIVNALIQLANGDILSVDGVNVRASVDNGGSWANRGVAAATLYSFAQHGTTGRIFGGASGAIYHSDNNGATWVLTVSGLTAGAFWFAAYQDNRIIVCGQSLYYSDNNGLDWTKANATNTANVQDGIILDNGTIVLVSETLATSVWVSTDNATSWGVKGAGVTKVSLIDLAAIAQDQETSIVYVLGRENGTIKTQIGWSANRASYFFVHSTEVVAGKPRAMLATSANRVFAFDPTNIYEVQKETFTLGQEDTTGDQSFISNYAHEVNITHLKIDDGGAFTDLWPMTPPTTLFPAVPALNDALYIGIMNEMVNRAAPCNAVFDLSTAMSATIGYGITFEYYNGAWGTLTIQDNTNLYGDAVSAFSKTGVGSVHWIIPTDIALVTIDGVSAYWVRARVSTLSGTMTPPIQQNREVYIETGPYIDVPETISGGIEAPARLKIRNQSDGSTNPVLHSNRIIAGLRQTSRGSLFRAYLNLTPVAQGNVGIVSEIGPDGTFQDGVEFPAGRRLLVEAVQTTLTNIVTLTLDEAIAPDYYGTYHVFVRGTHTVGTRVDLILRIRYQSGSGGVISTSKETGFKTSSAFELLDFGTMTFSAKNNQGDESIIAIQAKNVNGPSPTVDARLYDIILIPVDEWAIDAVDNSGGGGSDIGNINGVGRYLEVDSTSQLESISAIVKDTNNKITSIYTPVANGQAILRTSTSQRIWFLSARIGGSSEWISEPWVAHSIQLFRNEQFLGMRGAN